MRTANTLHAVTPYERRRLIVLGFSVVEAQREVILLQGDVVPVEPGFMQSMATLAEMAGREDGIDVLIGAGMLMLAGEIQRLSVLAHTD